METHYPQTFAEGNKQGLHYSRNLAKISAIAHSNQ